MGECGSGKVQFSILKQVGICLNTPASVSFFRSYKIDSCSIANSMLTTSVTVYSGTGCTGISLNRALEPVPSTCTNGTTLFCEENPIALSEKWPALGVYVEDSTCSVPTIVLAGQAGCTSFQYGNSTYSSSLVCDNNGGSINVYNNSLICDGIVQASDTLMTGVCAEFTDFPATLPENLPPQLEQLSQMIDITSASYFIDCGGAENLPGVEGIEPAPTDDNDQGTSGSSGDGSSTKYGGLGTIGLSVLLVGIALAGVIGAFALKKIATAKKPDDPQNNLL